MDKKNCKLIQTVTMTKLIFIRHARSDSSVQDDFTRPLTETGQAAAASLPELFKDTPINHIYSSPFVRSIHTVKPLADARGLAIKESANLQERKIGEWVADFLEFAEKQWQDFDYKLPNAESLQEVQDRVVQQVNLILETHPGQTIVIGTHGTALCALLNYYNPEINFTYFKSMAQKMPFFVALSFDNRECIQSHEIFDQLSFN